ncbi:MAG: hypothetical protein JWQ75_124 [Pseudarthrobacter sp.]|nr:hypothetical protein [Pseudarthrobacter sp.]
MQVQHLMLGVAFLWYPAALSTYDNWPGTGPGSLTSVDPMLFQCTLVHSPGAGLARRPCELTVDVPVGADGAGLQAALAARFGTGALSVAGVQLGSLVIGEQPLVDGAIIVDGGTPGPRPGPQGSSGLPAQLALAVHSGPGAGAVVPLRRGQYTIGRSSADILIPDPDLSRQHARLLVSETAITLEDLGSANGTEVDGVPVRRAVIAAGATIRCGHSTMSLVFPGSPAANLDEAGISVAEPLVISRHLDAANRAALVLTAVLPLAIGVGLAAVTGMWMFLALTAVSAVSVLIPVVSGRRQRRDLAAAVAGALRQDQERRRRAAPPLSELALAGPLAGGFRGQRPTGEPVWLRLGLATQPANIRFDPPGPDLQGPAAGSVPLTLNPAHPLTTVSGPSGSLRGLARSFIMQIAGYPRAVHTGLLVHGPADAIPLSARFLAGVAVTSAPAAAVALLAAGPVPAHRVLLVVGTADVPAAGDDADTDADADAAIIGAAVANHWQVIHFRPGAEAPERADIELGDRVAELRGPGGSIRFVPDLVSDDVFDRFCRRLPRTAGTASGAAPVPARCSLTDLLSPTMQATSDRWAAADRRQGLAVPVGLTAAGTRVLDLLADGPHVLVAGTTGSGKSELLRSLAMALALCQPPNRINLLFVDFKGGSGLGPLTGLPHCVGILTDLASHELQRSLASLRAEIRRREELLASGQAPDLASYRASGAEGQPPLPHLVVVIDEFRMLVDEAPAALAELMRIATIGRSLGIHLVMATQRPQGALTADIRANVTTSIALRVQSGTESTDVMNSTAAAAIGIDTPGRAFLARGTETPQEFQAASLAGGAPTPALAGKVHVRLASEWLTTGAPGTAAAPETADPTPALAAAPLVAMLSGLWSAQGGLPPRRPIAPPLPCVLPRPSGSPPGWAIGLGLADLPEEQRTAPLVWLPAEHGHLGFIGAPQSGAPEALLLAVHGLVSHVRESHLYILDADTGLAGIEDSRVGARAGLDDLRRAVRILERLAGELAQRMSRPPGPDRTPLILVIAGWGSWVSAFRSGPLAWAEDLVNDLVRDGARAGILVAVSGQRDLATARFLAAVPNRFYFPAGTSDEGRLAWPRLPETAEVPGRAVAFTAATAGRAAVCQFHRAPTEEEGGRAPVEGRQQVIRRPFRIDPLPTAISAGELLSRAGPGGSDLPGPGPSPGAASVRKGPRSFCIGLGGDDPVPVFVRIPAGGVLAVLGGPGTGKSNLLRLLRRLNGGTASWLAPGEGADPCDYWSSVLRRAAAGGVDRAAVALVDDADLMPAAANQAVADLNSRGITVVLTAGFSPLLIQRVPLVLSARASGTGLLIAPRGLMDGELFGVRFEVEPNPPPGRAVLLSNGRAMPVQLGWVRGLPTGIGGQSAGGATPVLEA